MARKKKSEALFPSPSLPVWRTGLYGRLSVFDSGKMDGESLETQIALLEHYVEEHTDLIRVDVYRDNGFTGTNFDRPGWAQLMSDVYSGRINCIVVKDLSRLGRNYIETGAFLERECPRLGIRFISVNDGYDSTSLNATEELSAALKNIVNDIYARDISRKVCSAMSAKRRRGDFVGGYAPYGYRKDPLNKNHLILDPVAAEVVRRVYLLRAEGRGIGSILTLLNNEDVPSPGRYRYEHGIFTNRNRKGSALLWGRHVLKDILSNPVYLGHLVQGKYRCSLFEGIPGHIADESEWDVVLNTHDPIIDEGLFRRVQDINAERKANFLDCCGRYSQLPREDNPYRKRLVCADCGRQLKLIRQYARDGKQVYHSYVCQTYVETGSRGCKKKSIRSYKLDESVLLVLSSQMRLFLNCEETLTALAKKRPADQAAKSQETLHVLEDQLEKKLSLVSACYSDWKSGTLTDAEYEFMKSKYQKDVDHLRLLIEDSKANCCQFTVKTAGRAAYWKTQIDAYRSAKTVTPELVDALIQEIRLHEDGSIEISFAFDADFEEIKTELNQIRMEVAS